MNLVSLSEIAEVQSGAGFPLEYQGHTDGDYPFAKVGDISEAKRREGITISASNHYISSEVARKLRAKIFPQDTIVFAKIGEAIRGNRKVITTRPMIFDNNVMGILPNPKKILPRYLFRYLDHIDLYPLANSTTVPSIRKSDMETVQIWLPPIEDQKRIVAILDQADDLRRKRQRALERLNQLGQAIFHEMFGDPMDPIAFRPKVALEDICSVNPKRQIQIDDLQEVSFLPMAAVSELGGLNHQESREFRDVKKGFTYFERGDVLVAKITPCFENGKASKTDSLVHRYGFGSTEFHVFRPSEHSSASYLFHLLWNRKFRRFAEGQMTGSAGQKRVPISVFKELKVRPPAKDELARFDERIRQVEATQITASKSLKEVNLLFLALQHRAFQGEL